MASIQSDAFSTVNKIHECPVVNHPILDLDPGQYKRQIEHFEYYWGLEKGGIDLESSLNHILLREDMSERLKKREWTIMPTQETLQTILSMAEHNKTAALHERRHCLLELPAQEYEYDFIPLHLLKRGGRPPLYVNRGRSSRALRAPYNPMPRIRSQAHPLFVVFMSNQLLNRTATFVMPEEEAATLMFPLSRIVLCWINEPPEEFFAGPDIWKTHRHPLSDDGCEVRTANAVREGKVRRSTRAPCRQPKTKARAATKPYARLDPRQPQQRTSALPYPGIESADDVEGVLGRDRADILAWIDDVASSQLGGVASRRRTRASCSWPSTWLEAEEKEDAELAGYRRERARDADNALHPLTNVFLNSGLIIGNGIDWSGYSSNNWAARIYDVCLLGKDAFAAAPE
ncbi:hypothetical protein EV122DRAFT_281746 [Schizophyllum commune]